MKQESTDGRPRLRQGARRVHQRRAVQLSDYGKEAGTMVKVGIIGATGYAGQERCV